MEKAISNYIACKNALKKAGKELAGSIETELSKRTTRDTMCMAQNKDTIAVYVFNVEKDESKSGEVIDEMNGLLEAMEINSIVCTDVHVYSREETTKYYPEYAKKAN